jgi:hypothetical protein
MPPDAAAATRPIERTREPAAEAGREQVLSDLIQALQNYPHRSERLERTGFAELLEKAQLVLEAEDGELADRLGVSRPTIGRWVRAETAPHPIGRPGVLLELADWAGEKLKLHRNFARRKASAPGKAA